MKHFLMISIAFLITGCATVGDADYTKNERIVRSSVEKPSGPTLVFIREYQFIPDFKIMGEKCKTELTKKVGSLEGKEIKIAFDRHLLSGMSTCAASL